MASLTEQGSEVIPILGNGFFAGDDPNMAAWLRPGRHWESYCDVDCYQFRSDMDRYRELIGEFRPPFVVEIGRALGGTALFLADTLAAVRPTGFVVSIDIEGPQPYHERIWYTQGDSTDQLTVDIVAVLADGRRGIVLLDGDHASAQVAAELEVYADLADYLVVEDTIIRGFPGGPDGPHIALDRWLPHHPEFVADPDPVPTQHPGGWLRRVP